MKEAFKRLKKTKRCYLVYAIGQKFIDLTETLSSQINKYSDYPIVLYYSDGEVNFYHENLIKQRFDFTGVDDLNLKGLNKEEVRSRILATCLTKPFVVRDFLKNYDVEEFVFLDGDILVSPIVDSIFIKYMNKIENYPLFLRYTWDFIFTQGRTHVSDRILDMIKMKRNQSLVSLCAGFFVGNKNCKSFFDDWCHYCSYQKMIDYWIEDPNVSWDFNDETVANALVWLYDGKKYVDPDFLWTWRSDSLSFAFDAYENKFGDLATHECLPNYYKIPSPYEIPTGLSVIPNKKINLLGTHGLKDLNEVKNAAKEMDRRFYL